MYHCMCVSVYACMWVCVCVCMYLFVCMWRMCVRIFQLFQFQVAYRIKQIACVWLCACLCMCVCVRVRGKWLHIYMFDSLGSEGVNTIIDFCWVVYVLIFLWILCPFLLQHFLLLLRDELIVLYHYWVCSFLRLYQ